MRDGSTSGLILAVVGPLLIYLFRRPLGRACGSAIVRMMPSWIVQQGADGINIGKCPRCKGPVRYAKVEAGGSAFSCPSRGESGGWT